MNRNADRVGAVEQAETPAPSQQAASQESFFSFPAPTELVELPSRGMFYPEGHPVRGHDHIEIGYMTTKHEEILVNKSFIEKGVVIDRLLDSLIKSPKVSSSELFSCDRKALLMAIRVSGYGPIYDPNVKCPDCGASTKQEFDLRELKPKDFDEETPISEGGTFVIELHHNPADPSSPLAAKVECRMLKGGDEERINKVAEKKRKKNLPEEPIIDLLRAIIVSVENGKGEKGEVERFIQETPMFYMVHLREEYARVCPALDMEFVFNCPKCDAENLLDIPMNANFFRIKQQVPRKRI